MLSIVLKVLSILGILLLCLLGLAVLLVFLVLFFPVSYRLAGKKNAEEMSVSVRVSWLFGLLRVLFDYPEPGKILVKVLPFTVFDSGKVPAGKSKEKSDGSKKAADKGSSTGEEGQGENKGEGKAEGSRASADSGVAQTVDAGREQMFDAGRTQTVDADKAQTAAQEEDSEAQETSREGDDSDDPSILKKFKKIKYTIRSIYDKIKNIWENISYYIELLREEESRLLFSHVVFRLGKILKGIRPRRIRGQILFGTGSPDTTGYAFGVYGMLSPLLGSRLLATPDFTRAVLEGDLDIAGHITVFTVLWNVLKVLLDKKLHRFVKKMKAGRKK